TFSASSSSLQFSGGVRPRRRCPSTPVGGGLRLSLPPASRQVPCRDFFSQRPLEVLSATERAKRDCPVSPSRFRPARLAGGGVYPSGFASSRALLDFFPRRRGSSPTHL